DNRVNPMLSSKDEQALFHQRAFAGDDVAVEFEAEKEAQVEDEGDKVESTFLPGWGSWTGTGLSKATRKQNKRIAHNPLHKKVTEGVKAASRKDAKLNNVIISEAQQRKGKKYLASTLPHQFEKREQYERSLRVPVGPEWTTKETFQRNTRPRVVVKQGIIAPMEKPLL
ncbi:Utp14-domain-containing protein, partial [Aureobasidium melanogenum]